MNELNLGELEVSTKPGISKPTPHNPANDKLGGHIGKLMTAEEVAAIKGEATDKEPPTKKPPKLPPVQKVNEDSKVYETRVLGPVLTAEFCGLDYRETHPFTERQVWDQEGIRSMVYGMVDRAFDQFSTNGLGEFDPRKTLKFRLEIE